MRRVQARKTDTDVVVLSRLGNDISRCAADVVCELARLPTRNFLLDGELIAVAQDGRPWFEATGLARQRNRLWPLISSGMWASTCAPSP